MQVGSFSELSIGERKNAPSSRSAKSAVSKMAIISLADERTRDVQMQLTAPSQPANVTCLGGPRGCGTATSTIRNTPPFSENSRNDPISAPAGIGGGVFSRR